MDYCLYSLIMLFFVWKWGFLGVSGFLKILGYGKDWKYRGDFSDILSNIIKLYYKYVY